VQKKKMAWMTPIVASRRKGRSSNPGAVIAGLVLFLVFGIFFFLFFNRSGIFGFNFPMIFIIIGLVLFIAVVLGISVVASSMSKTYKPPRDKIHWQNQNNNQRQIVQKNPYVVRETIQKQLEPQVQEKPTEVAPTLNEVNFCRYCGENVDREARFCYQCGSKL
jgi:hypothetical protein